MIRKTVLASKAKSFSVLKRETAELNDIRPLSLPQQHRHNVRPYSIAAFDFTRVQCSREHNSCDTFDSPRSSVQGTILLAYHVLG